jgi:hypothetical protein
MFRSCEEPPPVVARNSTITFTDPAVPSRACCCPARPAVRVIMPPTANRPNLVDLWLCGHHYRASAAALGAAGATVERLILPASQPHPEHPASRGVPRPRQGRY